MNKQFVYDQCVKLAVENGADEDTAKRCASNAADEYMQGKTYGCGKPWDLIQHHVKIAAGLTGKQRVRANKAKPKRAYRKRKDTAEMFEL